MKTFIHFFVLREWGGRGGGKTVLYFDVESKISSFFLNNFAGFKKMCIFVIENKNTKTAFFL